MKRVALTLLALLWGGWLHAQCTVNLSGVTATAAGTLNFNIQGSLLTPTQVQGGINMWHTCADYGSGFPQMTVNQNSTNAINITIQHIAGANPDANSACGMSYWSRPNGHLASGTINLFDTTAWGADCEPTMSETIAHEIGHALGMGDVGSGCLPDIMGPNNLQAGSRSVLGQDCSDADNLWTTPQETPPPPPPTGGGTATYDTTCDGTMGTGYCGANSPIILNLGRGADELSGTDDAVSFDIDADGHADSISWTQRGAPMAFLALDRNHDGKVDDGSELFGNHTVFSWGGSQRPANGFEALASYDSNGDGVIDAADAVWTRLLLWVDSNHDGISQPEELTPIATSSVTALYLDYHWSGRHDQHGNTFRYESTYTRDGERKPDYDVYFVRSK